MPTCLFVCLLFFLVSFDKKQNKQKSSQAGIKFPNFQQLPSLEFFVLFCFYNWKWVYHYMHAVSAIAAVFCSFATFIVCSLKKIKKSGMQTIQNGQTLTIYECTTTDSDTVNLQPDSNLIKLINTR